MRKFLINIFVVASISSIILFALTWYNAQSLNKADWRLPKDIHIIAIGPSTTGCALNEKHIEGFKNMSRDGTGLEYLIPLLPRILEENPQIDTVLINHGRFMFKHMGRGKKKAELQFIRYVMPFLIYDIKNRDWTNLLTNPNFYSAVLNPDVAETVIQSDKKLTDFNLGYLDTDRHNLNNADANWGIAWYDSLMAEHGGNVYTKEWILDKCKTTDYWSRKAIEICHEHNVVPVLFFTPLYHYERWCTWDGFCEYIKDYDENTLIADYEDFEFPDDSYYGDVHHLNKDGAEYFTSFIGTLANVRGVA